MKRGRLTLTQSLHFGPNMQGFVLVPVVFNSLLGDHPRVEMNCRLPAPLGTRSPGPEVGIGGGLTSREISQV